MAMTAAGAHLCRTLKRFQSPCGTSLAVSRLRLMSNRSKRVPLQVNAETILVIEPDILVRMVIADYLRECGTR